MGVEMGVGSLRRSLMYDRFFISLNPDVDAITNESVSFGCKGFIFRRPVSQF